MSLRRDVFFLMLIPPTWLALQLVRLSTWWADRRWRR